MIQPDEIYLANFSFGDTAGMKLRPVLCLTGSLGDIPEVLDISSAIPEQLLASDIVLDPSASKFSITKLKTRSILRLHKLATIHRHSMARKLGRISSATSLQVKKILRDVLNL